MADKASIDDLRTLVAPLKEYIGTKVKHVKTNNWYQITGIHFREADLTVEFSYETLHHDPVSFTRPIAELLDGRFAL